MAVDAFLVRMTLIPAVMAMLGRKAWWIPRWLDRILPSIDVEGEIGPDARAREGQDAQRPEGGGSESAPAVASGANGRDAGD